MCASGIYKVLVRISRLNRWERIETALRVREKGSKNVSPGLTAGSGLKLVWCSHVYIAAWVSPGLTAGSGLKLEVSDIATTRSSISRLNRWERIETFLISLCCLFRFVSPGLTAGSGLKLNGSVVMKSLWVYLPA